MSTANQRRVRRAVALALLLVLLLAGSTAAVAQWMARASNPANTFTAATLHLADSLEGNPILGGTVAPGTVLTGTVIITNGATMPVSITLSESAAAAHLAPGSTLAGALHLDVRECGPTCAAGSGATSYAGALDGLSAAGVALPGNAAHALWAPGEAHRYLFSVTLPEGATDTLMGQSASVDFVWTARGA